MNIEAKNPPTASVKHYLKLIRISHYIKNLLVFAPLIFGGAITDTKKLWVSFLVFLSFCAVSSTVYVINDIFDREKDRKHPTKCRRPIAAGIISVKAAKLLAAGLLGVAIICVCLHFRWQVALLLLTYLLLNLGYSFGWKNIPILDVVILVSGFFLRVLCGAIATDIYISSWLYLTVISLSLFLSLGKRRNELKKHGDATRKVLKSYPAAFLDKTMTMCLTMTNVFYALWSIDEKTTAGTGGKFLIFTVPMTLLITMRYSMIVETDSDGDPVEVLLHDKALLGLCLLYGAVMLTLLCL